jgi:hypothetical protein
LGGTIMPARSVRMATNGEIACFITMRTVSGSTTSTWSIAPISLRRKLPLALRWRSSEYFTASASNCSPLWNCTPSRNLINNVLASAHP